MSATDSESSIDWLATDNEDDGSEREEPEEPESPGRTQHPEGAGCGDTRDRDGAVRTKPPGRSSRGAHHGLKRALGSTDTGSRIVSTECQKNQAFSSKCKELQCYIHPLSTILHGLRSGRYRERLSSFQESVAMDRIQRIMGVLQNPCMGEKYVSIILKMEEMLKSWFPDVKTREQSSVPQAEQGAPSKKPKYSPAPPAVTHAPVRSVPASSTPALRVTDLTPPGAYSASTLKWLHTLPICSLGTEQGPTGPRRLPPPPLTDPALTQDSAVSSSTDHGAATPPPAPTHPPAGKISAPCLERLLKSTQSIVACRGATSGWS